MARNFQELQNQSCDSGQALAEVVYVHLGCKGAYAVAAGSLTCIDY